MIDWDLNELGIDTTTIAGSLFADLPIKDAVNVAEFLASDLSKFASDITVPDISFPNPAELLQQAADDLEGKLNSVISSIDVTLVENPLSFLESKTKSLINQAEGLLDMGVGLTSESINKLTSSDAVTSLIESNLPTVPGNFNARGIMASIGAILPEQSLESATAVISAASSMSKVNVTTIKTLFI